MKISLTGKTFAWAMVAVAAIVNVLGYTNSLYQEWWWFDRALHGYTIWAVTLWRGAIVFAEVFRPEYARSARVFLLTVAVGVAAGAIWEIAEWGLDQVASGNIIKGKYDTVLDIILDTIGAILAAFMIIGFANRSVRQQQ